MEPEVKDKDNDDYAFLEKVLNSLYDIGGGTAKKRKKKSQETCEKEVGPQNAPAEENKDKKDGGEKTIQSPGSVVPQVEVVYYYDPAKRPKKPNTMPGVDQAPMSNKEDGKPQKDRRLEKARLEVHSYGITGYKKEQQRIFEAERAIMLGAQRPKRKYVNYKELQEQIIDKKLKAKEEPKTDVKKKKAQPRDKKSTKPRSISAPSGQVGRFKDGMLVLSCKDLQTMKAKIERKK
ncbi:40S small subunit processome assembly factor 1 [Stigmatopora nigra]